MPQKLAEAAFRLFSRAGFDRVSVGEVAKEAGVTKGSFYWHFKSKRELIDAACAHYYRLYQRRMHAAAATASDPLKRLEKVVHLTVRTCLMDAENRLFTMEILRLAMEDAGMRSAWRQFYDNAREMFVALVEAARIAGQLEVEDARKAVNVMLDALEGIKLRALYEPELCSPEAERITSEQLMGILQAAGQPAA